jgi:hypothetical protein
MSERRLAMYPERPSEMAESYVRSIETFHRPPEFILSEQEKAEVQGFEQALCNAEFPPGFEFLENRIEKPPKNIAEIVKEKSGMKTFCVDWFVKTPEGVACLEQMGFVGNIINKEEVKAFLAGTIPKVEAGENIEIGYTDSRIWARTQLESKLREILEDGSSAIEDPEYFTILAKPEELAQKISNARNLKQFYKTVESGLRSQESSNVIDSKLVMITMHRERLNTLIASAYRQAIPLLQQYRLAPEILSTNQVDELTNAFPILKNVNTTDMEKMARLYSMIDKFITGIDVENGFSQISSEIQRLEIALSSKPQQVSENRGAMVSEELAKTRVDAEQMKGFIKKILSEYGLLSSVEKYDKKNKSRASDGLWQVVKSKVRKSFSVASGPGIVWVPESFNRSLGQKKPTGVLPLLDHEMTHVLQHENASKLGIGLLQIDRSARGSLWFETGATYSENRSFANNFNVDRGTNFNYLKAMQKQLAGGNISECTKVFYDSLIASGDVKDKDEAIATAVDRTLRLFKNGTEWSTGSGYLTNTEPLEYAEQQVLARNMPKDLEWLYFVGRANFQTLSQLYRIGWLKKEDIFIPNRTPSSIVLEELTKVV